MLPVVLPYNRFAMGNTSGSTSPCEYTVLRSGKKEKNRKIRPQKWSKLTKSGKNGPKMEKYPSCFQAKLNDRPNWNPQTPACDVDSLRPESWVRYFKIKRPVWWVLKVPVIGRYLRADVGSSTSLITATNCSSNGASDCTGRLKHLRETVRS
jgi:hypothetical protein